MGSKIVILFVVLLHVVSVATAQPRMVLLKTDKVITSFHEGDYIRFKRKDRDNFTNGFIAGISQDYFRIGADTTYLYQLEKIDMTGKSNSGFKTRLIGTTFITAGGLLFFADMINRTLVQDQSYSPDPGVVAVSASLVGTGLLMQFLNNDYYKFGRRKKVVVLNW